MKQELIQELALIYVKTHTNAETTVDEVYADLTASNVEEFQDIALTEESRESIRNAVADIVTDYADENGYINPEEIVNQLVIEALQSMSGESSEESPGFC